MFGLPEDFDASFFVGRTLELICFAIYQVNLHFDNHVGMRVEGPFAYQRQGSKAKISPIQQPVQVSNLMELLEHSVIAASGEKDGTLTLTFDNGDVLQCFDQPGY